MSVKIKFNIFNTLSHLFSFSTDKTNGWRIFVKSKLLFGALIMGVGVSAESPAYIPSPPPPPPPIEEIDEIFIRVEEPPSFPGGEKALMEFLSKNVKYPVVAMENGIQGVVFVRFVVNRDGQIVDVEVLRSVHDSLDREALRVVRLMPSWAPGRQGGKPVRTRYNLPIRFSLPRNP